MKPITTILRDNKGLTRSVLQQCIPAMFTDHAHPGVSDKYEFIPTHEILDLMEGRGFVPVFATQQATGGEQQFKRHMLRFRKPELQANWDKLLEPGTHKPINSDSVPEICLINSHDRTSRYILAAGLFRFMCSNGLLVADPSVPNSSIKVMHLTKRADKDAILKATDQIIESMSLVATRCSMMRTATLDIGQKLEFASKALELRYGNHPPTISTDAILTARRKEDEPDTIWCVMNRIQENFTHGVKEERRQSRPVTSLAETITLNQGLWRLAAQYCDASKN